MGNLIRSPKVEVVTKDGQCDIHITLDININGISTVVGAKYEEEEEKPMWEIPTFTSNEKLKLGKKE